MIDIENEVFTKVINHVRADSRFTSIEGDTVYNPTPPSFPYIELYESTNSVSYDGIDSSHIENRVYVSYEINVYSNKTSGKKAECKAVSSLVDEAMTRLGFTRESKAAIPNIADATIYRELLRYSAEVDKNKVIYTRR